MCTYSALIRRKINDSIVISSNIYTSPFYLQFHTYSTYTSLEPQRVRKEAVINNIPKINSTCARCLPIKKPFIFQLTYKSVKAANAETPTRIGALNSIYIYLTPRAPAVSRCPYTYLSSSIYIAPSFSLETTFTMQFASPCVCPEIDKTRRRRGQARVNRARKVTPSMNFSRGGLRKKLLVFSIDFIYIYTYTHIYIYIDRRGKSQVLTLIGI